MIHLKTIVIRENQEIAFPLSLPVFQKGQVFLFERPISIFIGENGCGKSTLLDLIAAKTGLYRIAMEDDIRSENNSTFKNAAKKVDAEFRLTKPQGFYFSAEDFTTYIMSLTREKAYARKELERVQSEYKNRSEYSKQMASTPFARTIHEIDHLYQKDLLTSSHGEAYLDFFASRMRKGQLYLLDEPETPLSIQNQLTLVALIDEAVKNDCQFIIATHSPILMGIPDAQIMEFRDGVIEEVKFEQIESVNLLKQYLSNRDEFFHHLRADRDEED
jgi:predicted ATPase